MRRSLEAGIMGGYIAEAELLRHDVLEARNFSGTIVRPTPRHLLQGSTVQRVERLGKQIAIVANNGRVLSIHLGMSGQVLLTSVDGPAPSDHVHARWIVRPRVGTETVLVLFRDPRRFGGLWAFDSEEDLLRLRWSALGPDALSIDGDDLFNRLRERTSAIKAVLLDQGTLAGVGNIYADESLHKAGIYPKIPARKLPLERVRRLARCICETLTIAIDSGGSTLRDYRDAKGVRGEFQNRHMVYGRAGKPCLTCGRPLKGIRVAQRTTVYCPWCQPRSFVARPGRT